MIKSPSVFSNNLSLQNLDNYNKTFNKNIKIFSLYNRIVSEYLELSALNIAITDSVYSKFVINKGIGMISHIFNTILLYTKNIELCDYYCNKASHYYIEFIGQIGEDSHSFLQLNSKDAILFVYKKTIFDINNEYRKKYELAEQDKVVLDSIKKETDLVNSVVYLLLDNINYDNVKTYIDTCIEKKKNIFRNFEAHKIDSKNYSEILDNAIIFIDVNRYNNISLSQIEIVLTAFLKKNSKNTFKYEIIKKKLKQNDIQELYENMTISKFISWLSENE